jgi:undecaprenyl-diphosphatase
VVPPDLHLPLEERLFRAVNVDLGPIADGAARLLSNPVFGGVFALLVAGMILARRRDARWAWVIALAAALALSDGVGSQVVRPLFPRARPAYALPAGSVRFIAPAANVGSIPSLHTANFFAMALVGTAAWPLAGPVLYLVAAGVAWSRMYVGVHWPGDVLGGGLWGTACALLCVTILHRFVRRKA